MASQQNGTLPKNRTLFRNVMVLVGIITFIFSGLFNKEIFTGFTLKLRVDNIDAVDECHEWHSSFMRDKRSAIPLQSFSSYCGIILTNYGSFELPTSNELWPFHESRASILRKLEVGCEYEVRVIGYGATPKENDMPRAPTIQTIVRTSEAQNCRAQ